MPGTGLWLRVFVGLLFAVLVPLLLLVAGALLAQSVLQDADPNLVAVIVVIGSIAWAAILAIVYTRILADDLRSLVSLARRGDPRAATADAGEAYRELATTLDERNRQVAALAQESGIVPIDDSPRRVIGALVGAVRSVTRDATWRCAVLASESVLLPTGTYTEANASPEEIGDLEQWAATADTVEPVRYAEGPWGAFTVVDLAVRHQVRAILFAPWEGRARPTPAEVDLLTLVGQHAGTALEHSLLFARVRDQADELNRLAAIQTDFLRGVTHDLQTPLTSIGALATELHADERIPDTARADLEAITHQADRLRRMVSQLLVASRLEAGAFTAQQEIFSVAPIIERTWSALRADRPFELRLDGEPHLAVGDPDRLEQVMWALLDNAVKYSPPGSPIEARVAPTGAGTMTISVVDRGAGMDAETRAHAFDQFYRARAARQLAPDGSGVGLYAARGLMIAMGGSLEISSELGSGTTTIVRIPAEPMHAAGD